MEDLNTAVDEGTILGAESLIYQEQMAPRSQKE